MHESNILIKDYLCFWQKLKVLKSIIQTFYLNKISFFYESGGLYSPHLHILDMLLHEESNFVSKCHVEELKKIFKPHRIVKLIVKAFCILTGIKAKRKGKPSGGVIVDYFQAFQTLMINQNNFLAFLKNINKYSFKTENIEKAKACIENIESKVEVDSIKNINQGIFQIYLWIKSCI